MAPKSKILHTKNADLAKYRDKTGALSQQPSAGDKLFRFVLQLLVLALWRSMRALSVPFGKLFAVYFWMGKSAVTLSLFLEKQLLKMVGWLSGTGWTRESRLGRLSHFYFGVDIRRWHVGLVALVIGGVVTTLVTSIRNSFDARVQKCRLLRRLMAVAKTYDEWRAHALELQHVSGEALRNEAHDDYDRMLLMEKLRTLKRMRAASNPREMMMALRIDLIRNVANIARSQKRRQNLIKTPDLIREYLDEVKQQLEMIAAWPETELPLAEKMSYFQVTRHAYGRTALLLSGGGGLGTFHLGVCKALFERGLLPRVLAGSSVGSIVCAVLGTRTDGELRTLFANLKGFDIGFFQNSTAMDLARHMVSNGHMQNMKYMTEKLKIMLGDCTFLEAFERTGRILNITVCPADTNEPSRLLNYMTAPQVMVWSAVAASSSFPGLYPPQNLHGRNSKGEPVILHGKNGIDTMERRWRDGSLEFDLPVQTLGELFNCNHFLVSQTNPHIVPLVNFKSLFSHKWASIMEAELKHRLQVVQWMLPEWKVSRYLTLWTQPWEGDITFTLPSMLWNLRKTVMNPSPDDLVHAVEIGEHAAWERMVAIDTNCTIEATLDKCMTKLKRRGGATGLQSMATIGGKVPSWLHMPTPLLGMHSMSWGDGIADNDANPMASWGDFQHMFADTPTPGARARMFRGSLDGNGSTSDSLAAGHLSGSTNGVEGAHVPGGRLPPIPSFHSSDQDGFDSASSVAAVSTLRASAGGLLRRADAPPAGSAGMSRRSSVRANLHTMAGLDHDNEPAGPGAGFALSAASSAGQHGGLTSSPQSRSNRSSISIENAAAAARASVQRELDGDGTPSMLHSPSSGIPPLPRPRSTPDQQPPLSHPLPQPTRLRTCVSIGSGYATEAASKLHTLPSFNMQGVPPANGSAPADLSKSNDVADNGDMQEDEECLLQPGVTRDDPPSLVGSKLWGALLPLATTCEALTEHKRVSGETGTPSRANGGAANGGHMPDGVGSVVCFTY